MEFAKTLHASIYFNYDGSDCLGPRDATLKLREALRHDGRFHSAESTIDWSGVISTKDLRKVTAEVDRIYSMGKDEN